jgi:hypothetical protein
VRSAVRRRSAGRSHTVAVALIRELVVICECIVATRTCDRAGYVYVVTGNVTEFPAGIGHN